MANICVIPKLAMDRIRSLINERHITSEELTDMSSSTRHDLFKEVVTKEQATQLNSYIESRLILKNQKESLIEAIEKIADIKPEIKRDMLSKVNKLSDILSEEDQDRFLKDLAKKKLGIDVTKEEANQLAKASNDVELKKNSITSWKNSDGSPSPEALDYGRTRADFEALVNDLKNPDNKKGLGGALKDYFRGVKENPLKGITKLGGIAKSLKAGLDNSALLRQGLKTLVTNPKEWATNAQRSFQYIWDTFGGKDVMREVKAQMYADPDYELAIRSKLAVGSDDYIPTTLQEKIPFAGKLFAASDNAFSGFMYRTRFDVFKKYIALAEAAGVDITDEAETKAIAKMVNAQTGRGFLGRGEAIGNDLNSIFFSPRFIKSQVDTIGHIINGAGGSNFVRKEAAKSLGKLIVAVGGVMAIANAINPGSAEINPRSTNFGKVKFGNHRADITGGLGSLITLAAREATQSSKSSVTNKIIDLNKKDKSGNPAFGATTGVDVLVDYGTGKLSPFGSLLVDLMRNSTFDKTKPTVGYELGNFFQPLPISTAMKNVQDPDLVTAATDQILDSLGASTTYYGNNTFKVKK